MLPLNSRRGDRDVGIASQVGGVAPEGGEGGFRIEWTVTNPFRAPRQVLLLQLRRLWLERSHQKIPRESFPTARGCRSGGA